MNHKHRIYTLSFCLALGVIFNNNVAYCENSVNYFKEVADEARQIRNQYTSRQEYLRIKQYFEDVKNRIQSINEATENNKKVAADINKKRDEVLLQQQENKNWFAQNEQFIANRVPRLQTLNEHSERMKYLNQEILDCESVINENLREVDNYTQHINTLKAGLINKRERYVEGSASFEEKKRAVLKALEFIKYEEGRLDEADVIKNNLLRPDNTIDAVYQDSINKHNDALWQEINIWQSEIDQTNEILQQYYDLRRDLYTIRDHVRLEDDLQKELDSLATWKNDLEQYNIDLKNQLEEAEKGKQTIEKYLAYQYFGHYISAAMEYYSWKGDADKGHQLYMPVTYFWEHGYKEYGVSVAYVNTSADFGNESESMTGLTDVSLHYGVRNANDRYTVKYTMDVDLPIGESKIGDNPLSDDFVPITRLNEGLNVRPGVEIMRRDGDENVWQAIFGYTFKGDYDYTKTDPGASVNPGDALDGKLRWTHAEKDYQMRFAIEGFLNGKTRGNRITSYTEGTETLYKAMYNRRLNKASELMGYFWLRDNGSNSYDNGVKGNGSTVRYYGLEYKYSVDENRAWYIRNNNMLSTGNYYDPINKDEINGREKHTLGVGYEINMQKRGRLAFGVNYYWLNNKNPHNSYKGTEFLAWFSKSI